jgi:hypothetical protein
MTCGLRVKHDKPYRSLQISFAQKRTTVPCKLGGNHRAEVRWWGSRYPNNLPNYPHNAQVPTTKLKTETTSEPSKSEQ